MAPRVQSRWLRLAPVLSKVRPDVPIAILTQLVKQSVGDL